MGWNGFAKELDYHTVAYPLPIFGELEGYKPTNP